jgi:hypothetical protein
VLPRADGEEVDDAKLQRWLIGDKARRSFIRVAIRKFAIAG